MASPRILSLSTLLVTLVLLASSCGNVSISFGTDVEGSGDLVREVFEVDDFTAVEVRNSFDVVITVGDAAFVEVVADDNLIDDVEVRVRNGELKIGLSNGLSLNNGTLEATVSLPRLDSLEVSGASTTEVYGMQAANVSFDVSGASDLFVQGDASQIELDASGSSDVNLQLDAVQHARLDLSGASSVELLSADAVSGSLSGASDLTVPNQTQTSALETSGAASVRRR